MRTPALGLIASIAFLGCDPTPPPPEMGPAVPVDPGETGGGPMPPPDTMPPEVLCTGTPDAGAKTPWRHGFNSPLTLALGPPRHRGIDLIVSSTVLHQQIRGEISYGGVDKALEDEQVDVFACRRGAWQRIGSALTDGEGRFNLTLSDAARLPPGQRPLYASVAGDRSGVSFLAVVLPPGTRLAVSDIDGTLTEREGAYPESLLNGKQVLCHDGAKEAFQALRQREYHPVYLTARGRVFTEDTRRWLSEVGLPEGPLRLAPQAITLPGDPTVDYKAGALGEIAAAGLSIAVGIGNRKSDADAYRRVSVPPAKIFLKGPEFKDEVDPLVQRGEVVGFESYRAIEPVFRALP